MKTYFNKLYTIEGAAKRSGIPDREIVLLIEKKVIGTIKRFGMIMLKGKTVYDLNKIKEHHRIEGFKKEEGK